VMRVPSPIRFLLNVYYVFDLIVLALVLLFVRAFKPEIVMLCKMWRRMR
jgi:hypothetical protein